jgi:hypothetical protein
MKKYKQNILKSCLKSPWVSNFFPFFLLISNLTCIKDLYKILWNSKAPHDINVWKNDFLLDHLNFYPWFLLNPFNFLNYKSTTQNPFFPAFLTLVALEVYTILFISFMHVQFEIQQIKWDIDRFLKTDFKIFSLYFS